MARYIKRIIGILCRSHDVKKQNPIIQIDGKKSQEESRIVVNFLIIKVSN